MKVVNLGERLDDAEFISPVQALEEAIKDYESGYYKGKKMLILHLDDSNSCYNMNFSNAGLKSSEMISLLEVMKAKCLQLMQIIPEDKL